MREIVAAHSAAAQQARDAFEEYLELHLHTLKQHNHLSQSSRETAASKSSTALSAFDFLQEEAPQEPPQPSAFGFLQESSAQNSPAAPAAAPSEDAGVDIAGDFQEYRAALECELCRWRVPSDGIDIASVVEISEGGARLVISVAIVLSVAIVQASVDMQYKSTESDARGAAEEDADPTEEKRRSLIALLVQKFS